MHPPIGGSTRARRTAHPRPRRRPRVIAHAHRSPASLPSIETDASILTSGKDGLISIPTWERYTPAVTVTTPLIGPSKYDKMPATRLGREHRAWAGRAAWAELARAAAVHGISSVITIDTYPGVEVGDLITELTNALPDFSIIDVESVAGRPIDEINEMIADSLTDDRVFGVLSHLDVTAFYDPDALNELRIGIESRNGPVIFVGWGAQLAAPDPDVLVLADLARWEIQQRQRAGAPNWRAADGGEDPLRQHKRSLFLERAVGGRAPGRRPRREPACLRPPRSRPPRRPRSGCETVCPRRPSSSTRG